MQVVEVVVSKWTPTDGRGKAGGSKNEAQGGHGY